MKKLLTLVMAAAVAFSSLVFAADNTMMAPGSSMPKAEEKAPVKDHSMHMHKKAVKAPVQKAQAAKKKGHHKAAIKKS